MWPVLLNMTRDDCRRTLRRLELEAYSNMISVFRAQGALEDPRRKLLEDLREALHIGGDRHSAEARRAANDELLATIAENDIGDDSIAHIDSDIAIPTFLERLSGPNTGLGWISEGRRRIPLMPRVVAQTVYTEIADRIALQAAAENEELKKRLEAERLIAPKSTEEADLAEAEGETAEAVLQANIDLNDEILYPPIVMEDQSIKILEMEAFSRKRKLTETSTLPEDITSTPLKNIKNTSRPTNQKHLNLSQIYSNFPKTPSGKSSSQSKYSYNQVSKVSNKSSQSTPRSTIKRRKQNPSEKTKLAKRPKSPLETPLTAKPFTLNPLQMDLSNPPSSFQASYAQSILSVGLKNYGDDPMNQQNLNDSPTMRLLTQPATAPHELGVAQPDDPSALQAQSTPIKQPSTLTGKPCQFIIKKKSNLTLDKSQTPQKLHMSEIKILKKSSETIKVLPKKQVIVAPNSAQKALNATGKVVQSKYLHNTQSKALAGLNSPNLEKVVVVSGNQPVAKSIANTKNIVITSSSITAPITKSTVSVDRNSMSPKTADHISPKGIVANDVKVSTKTFLLNPRSGQKMVVLPTKARGKTNIDGQTMPLLQFKGMPTTMKLVPVSSSLGQITKSNSNLTIMSRSNNKNVTATGNKIVGLESVKSSLSDDGSNKTKLQGLLGTKLTALRQPNSKGSVIVVQKGMPLGKTISFPKNSNEMNKIVMGKNVNKLIHAQKEPSGQNSAKKPGNVILLDLNDQRGPTTMAKILDSHTAKSNQMEEVRKEDENLQAITEDTPVLFDTQMSEETCNANSMDSISTVGMGHLEEGTISSIEKEDDIRSGEHKENDKDNSSVTDWEMELDTVGPKRKADDSSSLHLELCMSSDSETDAYLVKTEKPKQKSEEHGGATEETSGLFGDRGVLSRASRTLLSQLQDEGSSSNDSSFALNKSKLDESLDKGAAAEKDAKGSKTELVKSTSKRMDMFGAADMQLGPFGYLEADEGMMGGEDMFSVGGEAEDKAAGRNKDSALELQLSRLLGESSDTNNHEDTSIARLVSEGDGLSLLGNGNNHIDRSP